MYDKELIRDTLQNIREILQPLIEGTADITDVNELLASPAGVLRLRGICMSLQTIGESVKTIDRRTEGQLLDNYPEIDWRNVMRMRDVIAHHYFDINMDLIFSTLRNDIPTLSNTIILMLNDLS